MTITEANAVNVLLRYALGWSLPSAPTNPRSVCEAVDVLAEHAHKALLAGLDGAGARHLVGKFADRRETIYDLLGALSDSMLLVELGPRLSCAEVDAFAQFLRSHGADQAADVLYGAHAAADDEGDAHHTA